MAKGSSTDTPTDAGGPTSPRTLAKEELAKRLYGLMVRKGWRQADLARVAGLPRDSVSVYLRAKSLPDAVNAQKLADALGITVADLLPSLPQLSFKESATPTFDLSVNPGTPTMAWLRINRTMPLAVALKIAELLQDVDAAADGK